MAYGSIKVDNIIFTNGGVDQTITVSGIVASTSGNLTVTGTISGDVIRGGTTVSGATVTGAVGQFGNLTAVSGVFTTQVSGATVTGNVGQFTSVTGGTAGFTTVTGTTVTGTTANFVTVSGTTVTGTTANFTSGNFTSISGGTHTITSGVFAAGSATNPSISFASDPNTGIYSPGADQVAISTNGTGRLFVDASGNVGIGVSPSYTLDVNGQGRFTNDVLIADGTATRGRVYGDSNGLNLRTESGLATRFLHVGTELARITSDGKLGLGTSSVTAGIKFQVQDGTASKAQFNVSGYGGLVIGQNADLSSEIDQSSSGGKLYIKQGGNTAITVDTSQRVGIGTTSPASTLHVSGSSDQTYTFQTTTAGADNRINFRNSSGTDAGGIWYLHAGNHLLFNTGGSNAEKARIDGSGRLLVGTSSSPSAGSGQFARVVAQGNTSSSTGAGILSIARGSTATATNDTIGQLAFTDSIGATFAYIECVTDATPGAGDLPGRLTFSTTADGASSPTERMRIASEGGITTTGRAANSTNANLAVRNSSGNNDAIFEASDGAVPGISGSLRLSKNNSNSRSINASGTVNQNGADYAEYFKKCGNFVIQKADVVGINSSGLLTNIFADAISFCVKSTDPGLVGGDNWFTEPRPRTEDGQEVDGSTPEYAEWMERLELARATVDRIAFAGQVPVNVTGATPGQYIVPIATEDGGITGIAKDETDLTLAEYMQAIGKVIAIEDDGRARIIVKVA